MTQIRRVSYPVFLTILMGIIVAVAGPAYGKVIIGTPDTYRALLGDLQPGDTLMLEAGTYDRGLPLSNRHGEPGSPIIITGPETGAPAVFSGSREQAWNTVQINNSSYLTIRYLKLDGLDVPFLDAVNAGGITHHITLENLEIVRHGAHQLTVGVATRGPAWDWVIRNCKIIGAGTGMYLGNWQGRNWPFVGGLIEHNLFMDTVGYNVQIKQMNSRSYESGDAIPGMPSENRKTIIRHNVFSKASQPSPPTEGPRTNLLVGHFPLTGPGSDDVYEIYGNFFYENTTEALFQGEGNIALYDNVFVNSSGSAVNIQPHNNVPRNISVFHNTIVATGNGIKVRGVDTDFVQRMAGNAVFAGTPVSADSPVVQQDNVLVDYASAGDYLVNPGGDPDSGKLDLYPLEGVLLADAIDMTAFQNFSDRDRDFNGDPRTAVFRGAYAGEVNNSGWVLAVDIKPRRESSPTPPGIITQPASVTVTEGEDARFSVGASGSTPMVYQWFLGGSAIAGATSASYTVTGVNASDNGSVYRCDISNSLGNVTSDGAVLTVLSDSTAPTLVSAFAISDSRVDIVFSEEVNAGSAVNSANYQIDSGITVNSASLSTSGLTVSLSVSLLTADTAYRVQVSNVQDRAAIPNTIAALSSQTFTWRSTDGFADGNADDWTPLTASRWSVVMDEGDNAYFLNTSGFNNLSGNRLGEYSLLSASFGDFTFRAQARPGDAVGSNSLADYAVVFGFQDADNYDYVMFNNDQDSTQIFKVTNGTRATLATASSDWLSDNLYHSIEVSRAGNLINVRFDGNLILSANDNSPGAGRVGVGSYNDSAYFDDVSVTGEASVPPADTTPPVISLIGNNSQTITVGSLYTEPGASAVDNVDGDISGSITIDVSSIDITRVGGYRVTYNVTDAAGNLATEVSRTINVTAVTDNDTDNGGFADTTESDTVGGGGAFGTFFTGLMLLLAARLRRRWMTCARMLVLPLLVVLGFSPATFAGTHPNMYLSTGEIAAIKEKVNTGQAPWSSAYNRIVSDANAALSQSPVSVTAAGKNNCDGTINLYCTEPPYDTVNADRSDYTAIVTFGRAVRSLGLGYAFTGNTAYADKAIALIRAWALDPVTYMVPGFSNRQSQIEIYITLPGALYGADLIWNYSGWDAGEKAAFLDWVRVIGNEAMLQPDPGRKNFSNWRDVLVLAAGSLLEDTGLINFAVNEFKELIPYQISSVGYMKAERGRQTGLSYSLFAINAMVQTAEIARHQGIDLYNFQIDDGRGLELALDFHVGFSLNPSTWSYKQVGGFNGGNTELYELAYSYFQKSAYLSVVNKYGRPMYEIRTMGPVTLTHGNRFDLTLISTPPNITRQPGAVTVAEGEDALFSVLATGSGQLSYQWVRNGSTVAGATGSSFTVTAVSPGDNGDVYRCEVSNNLGNVSSRGAVLTVLFDASAPGLVSAFASNDTRVDILFSEAVSADSAENIANYQIDPDIAVMAASLSDDGRTVSLTVSPLTADTAYTVLVSNVRDLAQTPNIIAVQSSINFTWRVTDGFEDATAAGWTPLVADNWDVVTDDGDKSYYLNTTDFNSPDGERLGEYSLLSGDYGDFIFTAQARLGDDVTSNALADYAVIFGYQDPDNYYYVIFNNNQDSTRLFRVIDGSRTALAIASSDWLTDNLYHSIEISRKGSAISVRFDGNVVLSATDSSPGTGKIGVGSFNDSAYFDNVSVVASVVSDNIAPVIILTGDNPHIITMGSAYAEPGVTASDNVDGDISASITIDASSIDITKVGVYRVTYNVADAAENPAAEVSRTVNVVAASTPSGTTTGANGGSGALGWWALAFIIIFSLVRNSNNRVCHRHCSTSRLPGY